TVVFYFSGHGVVDRTGTAVGLLEDVKSQARRPWEATFGVQPLAQALGTIGAQSAWIFFDACQEISESISPDALNSSGIILKELTLEGLASESCEPLAIAGSKLGDMAYAPNDYRPPFFTQVLLKGLSGCCVTRTQAHGWAVTGEALLFNLKKLAAGLIENVEVKPQSLLRYSDEGVLSRAPAPFTSLKVRSLPESALKAAKSVRICLDDGKVIHSTQDPPYVWTVDVPLIEGNLLVDCVVAAGDAGLESHTFRPEPPIHHIVLQVRS
ncbi:hypothetical protein, partial [Shinella sp.]|uniref:hypothetical protein n=1 Tax=Shinella sp. TaxID=1870904 RepID=UPI003F72122E